MNKFKKKDYNEEPKQPSYIRGCGAHGCPLRGTTTSTPRPDEHTQYFCRFHIKAASKNWSEVTERINKLFNMIDYASRIKRSDFHTYKAYLKKFTGDHEKFNIEEGENWLQYADRINTYAYKKIMDGMI